MHDGDAVTATGTVVQRFDGPPMMCTVFPLAAVAAVLSADESPVEAQDAPTCTPLAVPLDVDVRSLPGWTEQSGGGGFTSSVTVEGAWRDRTLVVGSAAAGDGTPWHDPSNQWQVPCAPPGGGWASEGGDLFAGVDPEQVNTAEMSLAAEVAAHPDLYHASWYGYPDGDPSAPDAPHGDFGRTFPEHIVMIVSTVQDPSEVREHLATLFRATCASRRSITAPPT